MNTDHHHSFSYCYDVVESQDLAFNQGPTSSVHQENSTFLDVPLKRNSHAIKPTFLQSLSQLGKDTKSDRIIRFKQVLLPIMCTIHANDLKLPEGVEIPLLNDSIKRFLCHLELVLPTDAQWNALDTLRVHAGSPERSEQGIQKIAEYYAYLTTLEKHFAIKNGELNIPFEWTESFSQDKQVISSCIDFEKACTLFNAACIYSYLGAKQRLWGPQGKQMAADYFQRAAGIFLYIRNNCSKQIKSPIPASSDIHEQSLTAFASLMLAQASECFYEKSVEDKSSSKIVSMVAAQTSDLYAVCIRNLKSNLSCLEQRAPKEWLYHAKTKWKFYSAVAHFHADTDPETSKAVSERALRLEIASEHAKKALDYSESANRELYDMIKEHVQCIFDAYSITQSANIDKYHQSRVDARLLCPLKRPSKVMVNPIPCFESLKKYEDTTSIFHSLTSPKTRNDAIRLIDEYEKFVKDGNIGLRVCMLELDKIAERYHFLSHSNSGQMDQTFVDLEHKNQLKGKSMMSDLAKLQAQENVIPSEDMIRGIEYIISKEKSARPHRERIYELDSEFQVLKSLYQKQCADFSPLDWTRERLSTIMPSNWFNDSFDDSYKKTGNLYLDIQKVTKLRCQCVETLNLVKKFEENQIKLFETNNNIDQRIEDQKTLLFQSKTTLNKILHEKGELLVDLEHFSKQIDEQERSCTLLYEFSATVSTLAKLRQDMAHLIQKCASDVGLANPLDPLDQFLKAKSILQSLGYPLNQSVPNTDIHLDLQCPLDMRKIREWKTNLSSPDLNYFQIKSQQQRIPETKEPMTLKLKTSLVNLWKSDSNNSVSNTDEKRTLVSEKPKLLNLPSASDLKFKLLKENARLKDKFLSKRSPLNTLPRGGKAVLESDHSSHYESLPEAAEELAKNYSSLNSKSIQDWVKNQQAQAARPETSKRKSVKNLFDESMDRSSVIYMASVAAAAATSAGLSSVRQKVSFVESDNDTPKMPVSLPRRKRTGKSLELGRTDSGIGCTSTQSHSEGDVMAHSDTQLLNQQKSNGLKSRKPKVRDSLYQMEYENRKMVEALGSK